LFFNLKNKKWVIFFPEIRKISQIQKEKTRFSRNSPFLLKNPNKILSEEKKHCLGEGKCTVKLCGGDISSRRGVLGPRLARRSLTLANHFGNIIRELCGPYRLF
jgi:hypothetical protein